MRLALAEERKARALAEHEKVLAEQNARDEAWTRVEAEKARVAVEAENERLRAEVERLRGQR